MIGGSDLEKRVGSTVFQQAHISETLQFVYDSIVNNYVQKFKGLVEYIAFDQNVYLSLEMFDFSESCTDKPSKTVNINSQDRSLTMVIETLLSVEGCSKNCIEGKLPVCKVEQWDIKVVSCSLTAEYSTCLSHVQSELSGYFETSSLLSTVKQFNRDYKPTLIQRVRFLPEDLHPLGQIFLLDKNKTRESNCFTPVQFDLTMSASANIDSSKVCKLTGYETDHSRSQLFTPTVLSPTESLDLRVTTLKQIPCKLAECPVCLESKHVPKSKTRPMSLQVPTNLKAPNFPQHEQPKDNNQTSDMAENKSQNLSRDFLDISVIPHPNDDINSPMVVMSGVEDRFLESGLDSDFLEMFRLDNEIDWSESGTSTLTKKSSRSLGINACCQLPLESPPRKQQRVNSQPPDLTRTSQEWNPVCESNNSTISTNSNNRERSINKVIAEFTLLNVERELTLSNETSGQTEPTHTVRSGAKKRERTSNSSSSHDQDIKVPPVPSASSTSGPRLIRRRNAASASSSGWPSCTFRGETTPFFNRRTGLPLQSSPVPLKRSTSGKFDFDSSLCYLKTSKSSTCMLQSQDYRTDGPTVKSLSITSASNCSTPPYPVPNTKLTGSVSLRRRPASLRFTPQSQRGESLLLAEDSRPLSSARRRHCPTEINQGEISCSAPPSGDRGFQMGRQLGNRMANTMICTPVPHGSSQHLLVNFEESMLNGRIHPVGQVEGFSLELGASGSFYPAHVRLPMSAYFFDLSDDNAPSPYLGYADLRQLPNSKGYHVPKKGSIQLTLFNPTGLVVKMFVIVYDLEDMPPNSQTFLRQRTVYMPMEKKIPPTNDSSWTETSQQKRSFQAPDNLSVSDLFWSMPKSSLTEPNTPSFSSSRSSCSCSSISSVCSSSSYGSQHAINMRSVSPAYLRYLVHLRFHTTKSGKLYLHTDLRLIFSRDKFEFDPRVATYELRSFIDAPSNPRYSPKKWTGRHRTSTATNTSITSVSATGTTTKSTMASTNIS